MKTLPEHYSDYFYESLLSELPESFIVAEIDKKLVGYIMCKIEYGFSNFKKLGFVKKGHVVSVAVLEEYRKRLSILKWMLEQDIRDYKKVSDIIGKHYRDPKSLIAQMDLGT